MNALDDTDDNLGSGGGGAGGVGELIALRRDDNRLALVVFKTSTALYDIDGDGCRKRLAWVSAAVSLAIGVVICSLRNFYSAVTS